MAITKVTSALLNSTALTSKAFGTSSIMIGDDVTGTIDAANYNVGLGVDVFEDLTNGDNNTTVGTFSLKNTTTGSHNSAFGYSALFTNISGSENVAIGGGDGATYNGALGLNVSGNKNVAIGNGSLQANTTASNNTAVGFQALFANTDGGLNTAVGALALATVNGGAGNNALGKDAGTAVTSGSNNLCLGYQAGDNITTGGANLMIGNFTQISSPTTNFATAIGYQVTGTAGYTTLGHAADDIRAAHGVATWATVSDERYKKDITDSTTGLSFINALRPRTFKYKNLGELPETFNAYKEGSTKVFKNSNTNHGFIAQEVKAAIDADDSIKDGFKLWDDREDGSQEVAEAALIPVLVKAIQELSAQNDALEARIAALES